MIGREFARQLASQGTDQVIVARREERLQQLARELEPLVAVEVLVANLAGDADVERVVRRVVRDRATRIAAAVIKGRRR